MTPHPCNVATGAYGAAYFCIGVAYGFFPPGPPPTGSGRVSVAAYIGNLGPVWTAGFVVAAAALLAVLWLHKWQWLAHSIAAAVVAGYAVASFASGVLSSDVYGSPMAFLAAATVVTHLLLARGAAPVAHGRHVA